MIGCLILGTFVAMGAARLIRHHHRWGGPYGAYGGPLHGGHWRGGFGRACGGGMRGLHRHGGWGGDAGGFDPGDPWGHGYGPRQGGDFSGNVDDGDGDFAGHGWSGLGGGVPGRGAGGFILGSLLGQLRATATQERVIRAAYDEFRADMKEVGGGEGKKTRQDIGAAMRKPEFDEVFMGELFARQDTAIEKTRKAFVGLMARVHDVLDEEQRGRLANLVEKGPRFWRRGLGW